MSKFLHVLLIVLMAVCTSNVSAQQFTDPGFEDWSGAKFADKEQPKYWNFSLFFSSSGKKQAYNQYSKSSAVRNPFSWEQKRECDSAQPPNRS